MPTIPVIISILFDSQHIPMKKSILLFPSLKSLLNYKSELKLNSYLIVAQKNLMEAYLSDEQVSIALKRFNAILRNEISNMYDFV
ncbi:MAG TPA: hypothetical protein VGO09_09230 [Flavisolibacter sp.]|nr:hypothetical protein [Flavisolibacter sp.]